MTKLITLGIVSTFLSAVAQTATAASDEMRITKSIPAIANESLSNSAALATSASPSEMWPYTRDSGAALTVTPGQRVRVTAVDPGRFTGTVTGTLVKIGPDGFTILDDRKSVSELPLSSVTRLEVSQGKKRKTRAGMLLGALVGAGLGALAVSDSLSNSDPRNSPCGDFVGSARIGRKCTGSEKASITAIMTAVAAAGGAWWGHRTSTEVWSDAPVDRIRVSLAPTRGGARAALSFSF